MLKVLRACYKESANWRSRDLKNKLNVKAKIENQWCLHNEAHRNGIDYCSRMIFVPSNSCVVVFYLRSD